eukprot:g6261.t1
MVATKRKRSGQEYSEDDKLKHQATKALTKEAKRVKTFLLQQAIRKSKAAADKKAKARKKKNNNKGTEKAVEADGREEKAEEGEEEEKQEQEEEEMASPGGGDGDARGGLAASSQEVLLIKSLQPLAVVKICLRRLGLAHTGVEGEAEVEMEGSDQLKKLVRQVMGHKRIAAVLEELQERVTLRRREKLAESEGRSLPGQGQGRAARRKGKGNKAAAVESNRQQAGEGKGRLDSSRRAQSAAGSVGSSFVSLSGDSLADEEPSRNYYNKDIANANAGPTPKRWKSDATATGKSGSATKAGIRAAIEPGWAGAERAAGWGRGGGRSKNRGRGGRGGRGAGGRQTDDKSDTSVGAGRGRGSGARGGGAGGAGGGGRSGVGRGGSGRGNSGGGGGGSDGRNSSRGDSRAVTAGEEALHGSWAAKRALKEKEASATAAFSGKRITFGDDDD